MRISFGLSQAQLKGLDKLAERMGLSRASLIRRAIESYIGEAEFHNAFDLWREHAIDGLEYQEKLRSEWLS